MKRDHIALLICPAAAFLLGSLAHLEIVALNHYLSNSDVLVLLPWIHMVSFVIVALMASVSVPIHLALKKSRFFPSAAFHHTFTAIFTVTVLGSYVFRKFIYMWPVGPERAAKTIFQAQLFFWSSSIVLAIAALALLLALVSLQIKRPRLFSRVLFPASGLFILFSPLLSLLLSEAEPARPGSPAKITPAGTASNRVILVGADGASWNYINKLIEEGKLENFKYMVDHGATGELDTLKPSISPCVWPSIYTGRPPRDHRIWNFTTFSFPGMSKGVFLPKGGGYDFSKVVNNVFLKTGLVTRNTVNHTRIAYPFIWDIAGQLGYETVVTAPLLVWPVEPVNGTMVANRLYEKLKAQKAQSYTNLDKYLYPVDRLVPVFHRHDPSELLRNKDTLYGAFFLEQWGMAEDPDLGLVYLKAIDLTSHSEFCGRKQCFPAYRSEKLERIYGYVDHFLGKLMELMDDRTYLMVVSDHGFEPYLITGRLTATHYRQPPGVLLIMGPGVRPGVKTRASVMDVTPTILHLMGLPVARNMTGRVLTEAFTNPGPVSYIDSYDWIERKTVKNKDHDEQVEKVVIEELKALGYIQ